MRAIINIFLSDELPADAIRKCFSVPELIDIGDSATVKDVQILQSFL
jgi:hypothetical protein